MALNKFKSDGKPITNETEKQEQERNALHFACASRGPHPF